MSPLHLSNPFRRSPDAPTLKERAAGLSAGIARVARKAPPSGDAEPPPKPREPDPVDWHSPPPGFMASPAIEPFGFTNIATGIRIELERLHDIAQAEIDRRSADIREGAHETMRAGLESRLRRRFRLDEIKAALAPEVPVPAGIEADGMVYYEDAAGQTWRQSVGHWISFTAQRLFSVARQERIRQFNAASNDLDPAGCEALHARLTRELRIDALQALASRSDKVFEAEEARRQGIEPPTPTGPRQGHPDLSVLADDIIACWREDALIPEANREDGDPLYERWSARRDALLAAAAALPATRGALTAKALAFTWIWGDDAVTQGRARADHGTDGQLVLDIVAIVRGAASQDAAAEAPDPFFGAVAAARAASAAVDAFGNRIAEHKPAGWAQEEQALVAEQFRREGIALATVPTTQAGRIALADYMAELMGCYGMADGSPPEDSSSIWRDAYHALSAALRAPIRPEASKPVAERGLSALTLNDLAHLHMVASTAWTTTSMFINAPFSWDEKRENHNPLGDIIEAETDRWADLATAVAEEAARREPQGEDERDRRLEIATQQAMLGGGPIEDKALIADLAAAWGA